MSFAIYVTIFTYCFFTPFKQFDKHVGAERKSLNIDSIKRIINRLDEKVGHPFGEKRIIENDTVIVFSPIRNNGISYFTSTHGKTEFINGNSETGYVRKITIESEPIIQVTTYYGNGSVKSFQYRYSKSSIDYPIKVYEEFDKTGNLIEQLDPAKIIHFTISDIEKLVKKRGGERIIEATLTFSPGHRKNWYVRYFSDSDGLSTYVINAENGKIIGQKHNIVINE